MKVLKGTMESANIHSRVKAQKVTLQSATFLHFRAKKYTHVHSCFTVQVTLRSITSLHCCTNNTFCIEVQIVLQSIEVTLQSEPSLHYSTKSCTCTPKWNILAINSCMKYRMLLHSREEHSYTKAQKEHFSSDNSCIKAEVYKIQR